MPSASVGQYVAPQSKTVCLLDVVKARFGEKSGAKRRINWLFKSGKVDYFRVNYLAIEDCAQIASYWVEINDGVIIEIR